MKVHQVLNNNLVSVHGEHGEELLVMGRGIGFGASVGQQVDESSIEKVFTLSDSSVISRLADLLQFVSNDYLVMADEIVRNAQEQHGLGIRESIYLSLADHLSLAVERTRQGMEVPNMMAEDVKMFHPVEYQVGQFGVDVVEKCTRVRLPEGEVGFIAMHLVNASTDPASDSALFAVRLMREMREVIFAYYGVHPEPDAVERHRLSSQLLQLAQRVQTVAKLGQPPPEPLLGVLKEHYPNETECVGLVREVVAERYGIEIPDFELSYLIYNVRLFLSRFEQ